MEREGRSNVRIPLLWNYDFLPAGHWFGKTLRSDTFMARVNDQVRVCAQGLRAKLFLGGGWKSQILMKYITLHISRLISKRPGETSVQIPRVMIIDRLQQINQVMIWNLRQSCYGNFTVWGHCDREPTENYHRAQRLLLAVWVILFSALHWLVLSLL